MGNHCSLTLFIYQFLFRKVIGNSLEKPDRTRKRPIKLTTFLNTVLRHENIIEEFKQQHFWVRHFKQKWIFCILGHCFAQILRQMVSTTVKTHVHVVIQIWYCQGISKEKRPHFQLMCIAQIYLLLKLTILSFRPI